MIKYKIIRYLTLMGLILMIGYSCNQDDFLETVSKANLTDGTMWASEVNADIYLNESYRDLAAKSNQADNLDNYTDDNDQGHYYTSWRWKAGLITETSNNYSIWGQQSGPAWCANWPETYTKVRRLNTFIMKVNENSENFSPEWMNKRIDEARFLRAYFYSELFMRIGGLSIITTPQDRGTMSDEEMLVPRSSFEETFNFIISELDAVINGGNMPVKYNTGHAEAGRATIGAAHALKGWLQVFAASPAYNSADPAVPRSSDNLQSFATVDEGRWTAAAATNWQFITTIGHKGSGDYDLFPDMTKFWWEANEYNSEVIWDRQHVPATMANTYDQFGGPVWIHNTYYTWGNYCPTQEIVDEYQMANGLSINHPESGYDPQNPYVDREQRFYNFIVYDGAPYQMAWMNGPDTIYTRIDRVNPSRNEIDFGGDDVGNTGYYLKKRLDYFNPRGGGLSGQNHVYYRYGEVLLNYAEARNESAGPDATVYEMINYIRSRESTNLPPLPEGLSQDEMRKEIRRERRVELHYEGKRLYDIWRWKLAMEVMNKPLHSMVIRNSVPEDNSGVWVYTVTPLSHHPHVFHQKQYFNPVPQAVIDRNPKLKQNWGY
jgi:starch-binding outer membrane protein, SusD/RagB family